MSREEDYLWDPQAGPTPEIAELERLLAPASARAMKLAERDLQLESRSPVAIPQGRSWMWFAAVAVTLLVIGAGWFSYRLTWPSGSSWPVTVARNGVSHEQSLHVGANLLTDANESATLRVARIGTITVAPSSSLTLLETGDQRHRLELERGRLHAKVWAPPGYFGIAHHGSLAVDLGCEFSMEADAQGRGRLRVVNGWVIYNRAHVETLIPEGHELLFDSERVRIPIRSHADTRFRQAVNELDALLSMSGALDDTGAAVLAQQVADAALDEDYLTLLILITRHRSLMATPVRNRIQNVLGDPGDVDPVEEWWDRVPKPPKRWWLNWRDAL